MAESGGSVAQRRGRRQLLSVTEPTVREWIKEGKLKAHRAGARFWRIRQSEVDRMLGQQASTKPSTPAATPWPRRAGARSALVVDHESGSGERWRLRSRRSSSG